MPDIEQDAVLHRVIDAVQRHRQLYTAKIRCEMPTGVRHVFHKKLADVPAKLRNVPFRYGTEIGIAVYSI